MKRRQFLKLLGGGAAALVVAPGDLVRALPSRNGFRPENQYGDYVVLVDSKITKDDIARARALFERQIQELIPPKHQSRIRYVTVPGNSSGDPLQARTFIGWKYQPRSLI